MFKPVFCANQHVSRIIFLIILELTSLILILIQDIEINFKSSLECRMRLLGLNYRQR